MWQQRKGAQLSPGLPRKQVVRCPRHDDGPRRHAAGLRLPATLRGLAGLLCGGGGWTGGGRGGAGVKRRRGLGDFGGVVGELASQGVALLLEDSR